jgi:hypothetical protein
MKDILFDGRSFVEELDVEKRSKVRLPAIDKRVKKKDFKPPTVRVCFTLPLEAFEFLFSENNPSPSRTIRKFLLTLYYDEKKRRQQ